MREHEAEIAETGAEVVLVGTGNVGHARAFVEDERVPFPVLVDDAGEAARAASVERVGFLRLFHPDSFPGARRAWAAGHRIGKSGKRVDQLGATFVLGPGSEVVYAHLDAHTADHAPLDEVLAALAPA